MLARKHTVIHTEAYQTKPKGCLTYVKRLLVFCLAVVLVVIAVPLGTNIYVCATTASSIKTSEELEQQADMFDADALVVLGASIKYDGSPSRILQDRLDVAIDLYHSGVAPKIIMSGDNSEESYNEVMAMCNYAIDQGVSPHDIFCDHAGLSTYDSMYRIHYVFGVERCIIITQEYHLYRALYDAGAFGIEAEGCASDLSTYEAIDSFEQREVLARTKDFFSVLSNAEPQTKSEPVSLDQSGTVTHWW